MTCRPTSALEPAALRTQRALQRFDLGCSNRRSTDRLITRALLAIAPAAAERGGRLPLGSGGVLLLFGVLVTGLLSSAIAMRAAVRGPVLEALRSE